MTSPCLVMKDSEAVRAPSVIQNPVKSNTKANPNLNTNTINDDILSVMSDRTDTTKERSYYSDHDDTDSDHGCADGDLETVETNCTVKSILKDPEADWASIRSEGPWKQLEEPILPIGPLKEKPTQTRHERSVSFDSVQLRQYQQTLGDNPCVPFGPPVQLDWEYEEEESAIPINEYECRERKWKYQQQMIMNYHKRRTLLTYYYGFTEEELQQAQKIVRKVRRQRNWTKALEPVYILEDVLNSAYRRIKMFARKRSKSRRNSV